MRFNTNPTAKDFGNPDFGWLDNGFSVPGGDGSGGGGGGAPRGVQGAGNKGGAKPSPQKAYDQRVGKWMGELRSFHQINSRSIFNSNMWLIANPLAWREWLEENAQATPPRLGTRQMDRLTRAPGPNGT